MASFDVKNGLLLQDNVPDVTTNTLYNDGGELYFDGSSISSGGGMTTDQADYIITLLLVLVCLGIVDLARRILSKITHK